MRLITVLLTALTLSACSEYENLALYNNTAATIEVCNLHRRTNGCQLVPAHSTGKIRLVADEPAPSWLFRISTGEAARTYGVGHGSLWELRSHHCGALSNPCVMVQLEPDGLLYWIDTADSVPKTAMPPQPKGFPVAPGA